MRGGFGSSAPRLALRASAKPPEGRQAQRAATPPVNRQNLPRTSASNDAVPGPADRCRTRGRSQGTRPRGQRRRPRRSRRRRRALWIAIGGDQGKPSPRASQQRRGTRPCDRYRMRGGFRGARPPGPALRAPAKPPKAASKWTTVPMSRENCPERKPTTKRYLITRTGTGHVGGPGGLGPPTSTVGPRRSRPKGGEQAEPPQ